MKLINTASSEVYTFSHKDGSYMVVINSQGDIRHVGEEYYRRYYKPYTDELMTQLRHEELEGEE